MRKTVEDSDTPKLYDVTEGLAPRSPDGELIIKRRDIQSGRAMSVSTVQWSVAEKISVPTSMLEGFMWDKETEVGKYSAGPKHMFDVIACFVDIIQTTFLT